MNKPGVIGRVAAVLYLATVAALIVAAFDFAGSVRMTWLLFLFAATLPGSLVAWLGMWSLIHGADLPCFAVFFFACAVMNVFLASRIAKRLRRRA